MFRNHWSRNLVGFVLLAGCASSAPNQGAAGGSGGVSIPSGGSGGQGGAPSGGSGASDAQTGSGGVDAAGSGGTPAVLDAAPLGTGGNAVVDASASGDVGGVGAAGEFDCTMNAGDAAHHVGAEHKGHTVYGVVVDTTAGANMAAVGAVQKQVVMADLFVKFVWPKILVSGHSYEIAVFDDTANDKMCSATDRTWLWPVPKVTGNFIADWMTGHQPYSTGTCRDFPMGPLP
jgi:hypothetical protein